MVIFDLCVSFNDAPNVPYGWKIWTAGTLLLRSHAVVVATVCGLHCPAEIHKAFPEIHIVWRGAYVALKSLYTPFSIHSAFLNMQADHTTCIYAPPYHQRCWLLNWMLITRWKVSLLFSPEHTASMISNKNVTFGLAWPVEHFETAHFKWVSAHSTQRRFWTMYTYGFLFAWLVALVGICRWHGGLCLLTVVSGSIPGPI